MRKFCCPHNKSVTILESCPIVECPYHVARVGKLFRVSGDTQCAFYDSHLMSNETPSRTQISALSKDAARMVSPASIRGLYADMLRNARTLHALTHDVATGDYCTACGYVDRQCVSAGVCAERNTWMTSVLHNVFRLAEPTANAKALVWRRLVQGELHLDPALIKIGFELCNARDLKVST